MEKEEIYITWPDGKTSIVKEGEDWISAAKMAGIEIPLGCLTGKCGACEIEVNGNVIRSCVNRVKKSSSGKLKVDLFSDPYW